MGETRDPLRVEYGPDLDGLTLVRQTPPAGAASFSATYVGPAGWGFDPPGGAGTARLVNQLCASAAGRLDRIALARELDRAGATLNFQTSPESAELTVWGPAVLWRRLTGLLADVVRRPRFDADDIARVRRQMRERQMREGTQPASRADRELLRQVYPRGHPYRETGLGTPDSLGHVSRRSLVRFHREHYTAADATLVVTVPDRLSLVVPVVRSAFGRFERDRAPRLALPDGHGGTAREHRIDLPGRAQVEVRLGGRSIARDDPDFPAAFLANEVLGGRPLLSRLFQRVREKGGLAYHASSSLEAMRFGGYWVAQAGTGEDRWRRVVPMLEEEVAELGRRTVSATALRVIRESAIGEIPLALESTAEAHELAVDLAYHRLPPDHWIRWPASLRSVRPAQVRAAAVRALDARSAVRVIAGPVGRKRESPRR